MPLSPFTQVTLQNYSERTFTASDVPANLVTLMRAFTTFGEFKLPPPFPAGHVIGVDIYTDEAGVITGGRAIISRSDDRGTREEGYVACIAVALSDDHEADLWEHQFGFMEACADWEPRFTSINPYIDIEESRMPNVPWLLLDIIEEPEPVWVEVAARAFAVALSVVRDEMVELGRMSDGQREG